MKRSRRQLRPALAALGLVVHAYAVFVAPAMHAQHHALHGEDHVHGPAGLVPLHAHGEAHLGFHADVEALAIGEVATAGTFDVDCALAEYTLAECGEGDHAPHFGDALVTQAREHKAPPDPQHGRGSLEHLQSALVVSTPVLLPPPALRFCAAAVALVDAQRAVPVARAHAPRGPPASSV